MFPRFSLFTEFSMMLGRPIWGGRDAVGACRLLLFAVAGLALLAGCATADATCPSTEGASSAYVDHVYDGDTLRLADGRRVRLIGINAPETAKGDEPGEPFGDDARRALRELAPPGRRVRLMYGQTRQDRHGRTLAFVFSARGEDVQLSLLEQGLASALVVPPRRLGIECYGAAEAKARSARRGLWGHRHFAPIEASSLSAATKGYRLVRGTVQRVGRSRGAIWLNFSRDVAVRIPRDSLEHFRGGPDVERLRGARVEVRGWFYPRNGQLRTTVNHPAALTVLAK